MSTALRRRCLACYRAGQLLRLRRDRTPALLAPGCARTPKPGLSGCVSCVSCSAGPPQATAAGLSASRRIRSRLIQGGSAGRDGLSGRLEGSSRAPSSFLSHAGPTRGVCWWTSRVRRPGPPSTHSWTSIRSLPWRACDSNNGAGTPGSAGARACHTLLPRLSAHTARPQRTASTTKGRGVPCGRLSSCLGCSRRERWPGAHASLCISMLPSTACWKRLCVLNRMATHR